MSNNCDSGESISAFVLGSLKHSEFSLANDQEISLTGHKISFSETKNSQQYVEMTIFLPKQVTFPFHLTLPYKVQTVQSSWTISSPICLCPIFVPLKESRVCQKRSIYSLKLKPGEIKQGLRLNQETKIETL